MPAFHHDAIEFRYVDIGTGLPFIFQHGLGADSQQAVASYQPDADVRLISMDCRGHGDTKPIGPAAGLSFSTYVADLLALMDHLGIRLAVVGGISMGAALALRFAIAHPDRVAGLVISRISTLDQPWPPHLRVFRRMAALISAHGPEQALPIFQQDAEYQRLAGDNAYTASALAAQFTAPRAEEAVQRLERIPGEVSFASRLELHRISVPTLVMASAEDPVHPRDYGVLVAGEIPGARYVEVTPKSVDPNAHLDEVQQNLTQFLADVHQGLLKTG